MLGIYSLIRTICHKLMWFYQNAVLFQIIFVVTHGEIFSHLGHTGPLTVNKMALPSMYRQRWRHIHVLLHSSHTPQTDELSLVLWSTVSQNLRPLEAARTMWVYFTLCQQSTLKRVKTRGARSTPSCRRLSGKLWYLQHNCVGDIIVNH